MASGMPEYRTIRAAEHKKMALPDKFVCKDCHKTKTPPQFSNNELNQFRWKKANDSRINGITAKLCCRVCKGEQITELQCTGPCGLWKSLDEYSRAQRRDPNIAWCERCTQWKEANEPSVTPMPAPNTIVAPDEESGALGGASQIYADNIEGGSDSDDDGVFGMGDFGFNTMSSLTEGGEADTYSASGIHPQQSNQSTTRSVQKSSVTNPYGTRTEIPDGIMMLGTQDSFMASSSNSENANTLSGALGEGWNTVCGKRPAPGIAYNAWDNLGEMHKQVRAPSTTAGTASNPGQNSARSTPFPSSNRMWAKPIGTRVPAKQFPMTRRPIRQTENNAEDEDSPDEL